MAFVENLLYLRRRYDVTQSLQAEEIGVPVKLLRRWEVQGTAPEQHWVERIAAYFRVGKDWLLAEHELSTPKPARNNPLDWKPSKASKVQRVCLRCDRAFASTGPQNRICLRCQKGPRHSEDPESRYHIHTVRL